MISGDIRSNGQNPDRACFPHNGRDEETRPQGMHMSR